VTTLWLVRPDAELDRTGPPRILIDARHSLSRETEGLQRGRKLQRLTFRYKHKFRQECIPICQMTMPGIGFDDGCESCDENGKPERLDTSPDVFCAVVRVADVAVLDGLVHPFLLTGNTGAAPGVHTRRAQTLQCVHPQRRKITTCLRERDAELSDACRTAFEAEMNHLPAVRDGTGARNRTAR
jgi:hypothetical protein